MLFGFYNEVRSTRDVFGLFVPEPVLDKIAKEGLNSIKLGGAEEGIATILFTDIRSFSAIAEKLSPNETLAFLNEFMTRMPPVIHANGGFINQFVGDEIMAIFYKSGHSDDAIQTAIAMRKALKEYNRERTARGEPPIDIGVGVNFHANDWQAAQKQFEACLQLCPSDPIVRVYLERCRAHAERPPTVAWRGVTVLQEK